MIEYAFKSTCRAEDDGSDDSDQQTGTRSFLEGFLHELIDSFENSSVVRCRAQLPCVRQLRVRSGPLPLPVRLRTGLRWQRNRLY